MWTAIISAFVPAAVEGVKQLINKVTGGVKPTTVAEQIQLDNSDIEKLKALAELDKPIGTPSQWVVDLRASSRYLGALLVIVAGVACLFIPEMPDAAKAVAMEAANVCFGFLFGHRIMVGLKGK